MHTVHAYLSLYIYLYIYIYIYIYIMHFSNGSHLKQEHLSALSLQGATSDHRHRLLTIVVARNVCSYGLRQGG